MESAHDEGHHRRYRWHWWGGGGRYGYRGSGNGDFPTYQDIQDATFAAIQRAFDLLSKNMVFSNNNVIQLDGRNIATQISKTRTSKIGVLQPT